MKNEVVSYVKQIYQVEPDYPFRTAPEYAVFRHSDNKKWFALLMNVNSSKLGLGSDKQIDILNLKCSPMMAGTLREQAGILPAYHMNRDNWISVLLDGTVPKETVCSLVDLSFNLTAPKHKRIGAKEWLIPANPKYCDIEGAINENPKHIFYWKQSSSVSVNDIVYLYVTAPVSAILYKCKALEVDIPWNYQDEHVRMSRVMRLKMLENYTENPVTREILHAHGVTTVRGPRYMPSGLVQEIDAMLHK